MSNKNNTHTNKLTIDIPDKGSKRGMPDIRRDASVLRYVFHDPEIRTHVIRQACHVGELWDQAQKLGRALRGGRGGGGRGVK